MPALGKRSLSLGGIIPSETEYLLRPASSRVMMTSALLLLASFDSRRRSSSSICPRGASHSSLLDAFLTRIGFLSPASCRGFPWPCLGQVCHINPQLQCQPLAAECFLQLLHLIFIARLTLCNLLGWARLCCLQIGHVIVNIDDQRCRKR